MILYGSGVLSAITPRIEPMSGRHRKRRRARARLSPLTVIGELLFVAGLIVGGYLLWQPWYTTVVVAGEQVEISRQVSAQLRATSPEPTAPVEPGVVPATALVGANEDFGVIYIPTFGNTFSFVFSEGSASRQVLNAGDKGIGRYDSTQMPGEPGNMGLAAHRSGPFTTPFRDIMSLRVGDAIFIETAQGWYTYRFRSLEYVWPHETDVLSPFPRLDGVPGEDQVLTLTTCHPENWSIAERAIAYAVLEDFQPSSDGPPAELLEFNPAIEAV